MQYIGVEPSDRNTWHKRDIPEGEELIGLSVGMTESDQISRLKFAVWTPNHLLEELSLKPVFYPRWKINLIKSVLFGTESLPIT